MRILVTHNYYLPLDPKQFKAQKPYPPLGTLYAASVLRKQTTDLHFHDVQFQSDPNHFASVLSKVKPEVVLIYEDGFNYLTKMCLTNMREAAFRMIELAKEVNAKVWISGSDSTDHYTEYLDKGADVVLFGEGEQTLVDLIQNPDLQSIKGIAFYHQSKVVSTPKRPVLNDLDSLGFPAWDLLDIVPYQKAWSQHGYFSINIATTRGCPFKCNWCAKPIYGNRYNSHSPEYITQLIEYMKSLFSFDHIWFCDDIFGLKPNWVQEFSHLLFEKSLRIPFKIQSRADLLVKENTVEALAQAGCDEVWIGAESGSQKILDAMDKGTSIDQIRKSSLLMKQYGINPCFFLQFGYLGEDWQDIQATLQMVEELMPYDIGVSVSYPLPGTPFYEKVQNQLTERANWTDSDELLMMYQANFSPDFYKTLHRLLHRRFRSSAAWRSFRSEYNPKELLKGLYHGVFHLIEKRNLEKHLAVSGIK
jgi:anaerobic magnesium-protoporphyrin IX monomethyl ester cyclase